MDVDVLHRDLLLALAAMAVKPIEQQRIAAGELVRLAQVLAATLESLFAEHGAPVAFHGGVVCGDELRRDHALDFVFRANSDERRRGGFALTLARLLSFPKIISAHSDGAVRKELAW
jgi:hypothetical protein